MKSYIITWIVFFSLIILLKIIHVGEIKPKINKSGIKYEREKGAFADIVDVAEYEKMQRQNSKSLFWCNIYYAIIFIVFCVGLYSIYQVLSKFYQDIWYVSNVVHLDFEVVISFCEKFSVD